MEKQKSSKVVNYNLCKKCNYRCSRMYDYQKHLLTAKHNMEKTEKQKEKQKSLKVVKSRQKIHV